MGAHLRNALAGPPIGSGRDRTSASSRAQGELALMPVYKRRNTSGKIVWFYKFQSPGASRNVLPIREFGFATKQAAVDAEVVRRTEEQKRYEMAKAGAAGVAAAMPKTLA